MTLSLDISQCPRSCLAGCGARRASCGLRTMFGSQLGHSLVEHLALLVLHQVNGETFLPTSQAATRSEDNAL